MLLISPKKTGYEELTTILMAVCLYGIYVCARILQVRKLL